METPKSKQPLASFTYSCHHPLFSFSIIIIIFDPFSAFISGFLFYFIFIIIIFFYNGKLVFGNAAPTFLIGSLWFTRYWTHVIFIFIFIFMCNPYFQRCTFVLVYYFFRLFYYLVYFCHYLWDLLYFLVLFISFSVLFQLTFSFIYSIFSKKFSISTK